MSTPEQCWGAPPCLGICSWSDLVARPRSAAEPCGALAGGGSHLPKGVLPIYGFFSELGLLGGWFTFETIQKGGPRYETDPYIWGGLVLPNAIVDPYCIVAPV